MEKVDGFNNKSLDRESLRNYRKLKDHMDKYIKL